MRIVIIPACCYSCPRLDEVSNPGFYTAHPTSGPSQTNPWQQALLRSRSIWPGRSPRIVPILVAQFTYSLNYWSGLQIWSIMKHDRCFLLSLALTSCIYFFRFTAWTGQSINQKFPHYIFSWSQSPQVCAAFNPVLKLNEELSCWAVNVHCNACCSLNKESSTTYHLRQCACLSFGTRKVLLHL